MPADYTSAEELETTGRQILDELEMPAADVESEQNDGSKSEGEKGSFLQVSGLRFTIDTSIPSSVVTDEEGMFESVDGAYRVQDVEDYLDGVIGSEYDAPQDRITVK